MTIPTPLGEVVIEAAANGEVMLAKGELPHTISNGMTIDGSTACVLTVQPVNPLTDVVFAASLTNPEIQGYPGGGECLDCLQFENEDWHLTFGTEDQEVLDARLPRFGMRKHSYPVAYSNSQMTLRLDSVKMKTKTTFHIIVSYKRLPDERECSAWYFADTPHERALQAASNPIRE